MRRLIWTLLTSDSQLNDLGITEESLIAAQAVDTPPMRPFALIIFGTKSPGASRRAKSKVRNLTIWVHDEPADYTRIDAIIERMRAVLEGTVAVQEPGGGWLTQAEWTDDSSDLADDGYGTITRSTSFRVIGSDA